MDVDEYTVGYTEMSEENKRETKNANKASIIKIIKIKKCLIRRLMMSLLKII